MQPADVADFVRAHIGDVDPSAIQAVGHGEWSRAFYVRGDLVVRFSATDEDFRKDQWVMEHAPPDLPVPKLLELGRAFDGFYAISERATGEYIEERDADAMQRLLPSLFQTLDAMRGVDLSGTGGFGLWRDDGTAPHATWQAFLHAVRFGPPSSRTQGWRERLATFPEAQAVFERGLFAMERLVVFCPTHERSLVHSDLLYFNVLVTDDRVSCVLDWGSSLYGDFLWDLAWFTFWQPWYTAWASVDIVGAAVRHFGDLVDFSERVRCYELAIGLDGIAYQAWTGHAENLAWTTRRVRSLIEKV